MSHTVVTDCSDSKRGDDTLIIIVGADGTLSVDPGTLQKLLANQHHNSAISLVRFDAKNEKNKDGDGACEEDDDDPDSRINLTVEGYYPPTPAPSSPTPPPTPVADSGITPDGGGSDVLADSITEILQPEDVEKLETALLSVHAKEILGDDVLDMLQKNGEKPGLAEEAVVSQQGSVGLDHCYASLTGPAMQPPTHPTSSTIVLTQQPTRGTVRGRGGKAGTGRGRGGLVQTKLTLTAGASMVPVIEQLVMPGLPVSVTSGASVLRSPGPVAAIKNQATVSLQRLDLQQVLPTNVVPCKVLLNKVPVQPKPMIVAPSISGGGDAVVKPQEGELIIQKKKGAGRGRGLTTRGRGQGTVGTRGRGHGRGRGAPKFSVEEEVKNKKLAEEMAATVHALSIAEAEQLANIESMDQSGDADRVIPLVNKLPVKKTLKIYRKTGEIGPKTVKVLKPEKPPKPKTPRKSMSSESSSHEDKVIVDHKKEEKVIVVSIEPQITPAVVSAVLMSHSHPQTSVVPATPTPTPTAVPASGHRKNYPKRENRKPPAHLVEAFGPALFSTPDIIRRVSTDKPSTPTTPAAPVTSAAPQPVTPVSSAVEISPTSKLEDELGLTDSAVEQEQDSIMQTINSQVSKQEDQLLEEALLLEDLTTLPADDILQDDALMTKQRETVISPSTPVSAKKQTQKNKNLSQTSLSAFFPKVAQSKQEMKSETVLESSPVPTQMAASGVRKLPPVELPATRGATKRASLQKDQVQEIQVKKQDPVKKAAVSNEKRKSTDSKKSTESRKSVGRSLGEESEDMLVSDDISDEEGSYNSEDDPNRLWCICKRPHNNRFMICCDFCEDWFHGKCVGITKAMGEQMEEEEIEWMCPNCKKKKKQEEAAKKQVEGKGGGPLSPRKSSGQAPTELVESPQVPKEKKPEASKVIVQHQKLVVLGQETPKNSKGTEIRITKVSAKKSADEAKKSFEEMRETTSSEHSKESAIPEFHPTLPHFSLETAQGSGVDCIVCKKEAFPGGVYCSDECIAKHTSDSLSMIDKSSVIVFEKKTGRIYGGPNGPTAGTLTSWLMAHPSYQVMRPGVLPSAKFYNQQKSSLSVRPQSLLKQTVLQTRPQGIQLIAALPQPPPIEGPLKKNLAKAELSSLTPKTKQTAMSKGQQQITSLLKVQQPKQEVEPKPAPAKSVVTPPVATGAKKTAKEPKKPPQQPVVKKTTPTPAKKVVKEEAKTEQKKEEGRGKDFEEQNVRASVRKTLLEVLTARLQETTDLRLTEDQIKKIATQIEDELYALFKETNVKYKAKYRSLMFNIKDKNNLTLFRKIADKSISPCQLVRLTPEELASQELAQWREREARHQLEMIKKTELDMMQQAKTIVMKTHKGEQVVENDDGLGAKVLETSVEIEPVINVVTPITTTVNTPPVKPKEVSAKVKEDKHSKKDEKHKERRHSHKSSHHRDNERSRSRHNSGSEHRSKSKSRFEDRSRSESSEEASKGKGKIDVMTEVRSRSKSRSPHRSRSRHRSHERERSKSKPPSDRGRSKSRHRERSKSRHGERSKSKPRERSKSRTRERSKSLSKDQHPENRSKSRTRSTSKNRSRDRSKSQLRNSTTEIEVVTPSVNDESSQPLNIENIDKVTIQPAIFDAEIKEIIHDVVVEEEIGVEAEDNLSDHEPSSTVNISTPPFNAFEDEEPLKPPIWRGTLLMPDVAKFSTSIQEVSGICGDLEFDLPEIVECVGRISPETAWDYIAKMKKSGTKQILVVRFSADNEEDKMSYLSFYSYLSSRNRLGVVGNNSKMIKDFYILPLPSHSPVPQVLLPLDGPGFEDYRPHLLLGIIVRTRRKRLITDSKDIPFMPKVAKKSERSYTPPLPDEGSHTPTQQHPDTESFTPPHSPKPTRIIKLKPRANKGIHSPTVSDDYILEGGDTPYTPEDEDADAPYSPGDDDSQAPAPKHASEPACSAELQRKVDELNRMINDIEERKQKIDSMSTIVGMSPPQEIMIGTQEEAEEEIEEAYSPSGSITPPPTDSSYLDKGPSKISLPSDLQEIIASIKKKPEEPKSMDLKSDPIVQAYRTTDEVYSPEDDKPEPEPEPEPVVEDKIMTPPSEDSFPQPSAKGAAVKVSRDPRQRSTQFSLSQLSDEEIMKKASEMGFMNPENPEPIPDKFRSRSTNDLPHSGLEDEYDPFIGEEDRSEGRSVQPSTVPPVYMNQPFPSSQLPFTPDFPPPPRPPHLPPPSNYPPTSQFQHPHMYQTPIPPPLPPMPPTHIPFTNPQPPPPPPQPAPLPPPPPCESPELTLGKKKKSKKKSRDPREKKRDSKEKKEKRKYSESPPPKDYDYDESKFDRIRDRDRYSKKREKRDTWRTYDKSPPLPEKRRESWEYESPPPPVAPLPPIVPGPPPHSFGMQGPMRGGPMRGGRFQRGMRGGYRRGFDRPMRGFHRGGFHQRGHHLGGGPPPGTSRNFHQPKSIHNEFEEDIRRFEEQRKQKNLERRRWRDDSTPPPVRKRRSKDDDSD